jgi:pyruvate-formate lyase-activating enzyme
MDRLVSRLQSYIPRSLANPLAADLDSALRAGRTQDFMRLMDVFQARLYSQFLKEYHHESFSRLLALKLCNLAIAKYHFRKGHSVLVSRPFQLTVDPANACQLGCPGCVHSTNPEYAHQFDWPRSTLPLDVYERFLDDAGPFAFCASLYNYGEPLLHKRFADFVRLSKRYLLFTTTSTNLSMPVLDTDAIVASGLDRMVLSIDGTTQDVYERYRKKGRLDLVLENVRKLVASKKALGYRTPYLVWQFLTFEHNANQVNEAIGMAREIGVNEILVHTPFGVEHDDPGVRVAQVRKRGSHVFDRWTGSWCSPSRRKNAEDIAPQIQQLFDSSWEQRWRLKGEREEGGGSGSVQTCSWLYQNVTIDGAARIMPCCMSPDKSDKKLVFANFPGGDLVNSSMAELARLAFADRKKYDEAVRLSSVDRQPYCARCSETPAPYGLANVSGDIRALDEKGTVPRALRWSLTNWA